MTQRISFVFLYVLKESRFFYYSPLLVRGSLLTRMPKSDRFRFLDSGIDPIFATAADLLAGPPHLLHTNCLSCSYHTSPDLQPLGEDARHFVRCAQGLRRSELRLQHSTISDRVRDELAYILERCNIRVITERPGSHRQM